MSRLEAEAGSYHWHHELLDSWHSRFQSGEPECLHSSELEWLTFHTLQAFGAKQFVARICFADTS